MFRYGGEIGLTRVVKILFAFGMIPPLPGQGLLNANDNEELVAVAA